MISDTTVNALWDVAELFDDKWGEMVRELIDSYRELQAENAALKKLAIGGDDKEGTHYYYKDLVQSLEAENLRLQRKLKEAKEKA